MGVQFLGKVPIEPAVAQAGDDGLPIVESAPDSASAKAFRDIVLKIVRTVENEQAYLEAQRKRAEEKKE